MHHCITSLFQLFCCACTSAAAHCRCVWPATTSVYHAAMPTWPMHVCATCRQSCCCCCGVMRVTPQHTFVWVGCSGMHTLITPETAAAGTTC
jgi:hypothetical protein